MLGLSHLHAVYRTVDCGHGVGRTHGILTSCLEPVQDTHNRSGPDPYIDLRSYPEQDSLAMDEVLLNPHTNDMYRLGVLASCHGVACGTEVPLQRMKM